MNGYLQIALCEPDADVVILGGAGFTSMSETRREFARVPCVADSELVLDLMRGDYDIVDDKYIDRGTAEALLGESIESAKERAHG